MNKFQFIEEMKPRLKTEGYVKRGNYWHKSIGNELIQSILVSGSQWDKNDYYIELGISLFRESNRFPNQLQWQLFKRCTCGEKQMNLSPDEVIAASNAFFRSVDSVQALEKMLDSDHVIKVGNRWAVMP